VGPAGAAHSTWLRRPDGPRGPCEYGFNKRRDVPRERDGALFLRFPSGRRVRDAGHRSARHDRYNRHRPQRRTARAAGRIRFAAAGVSLAALGKFSGNARLPPRGVSPLLTSPCPAPYAGRLGRSPLFATGASSRRPLRPCGRIRRMNSLYQPSVTVGARCQPNVPVGPVPADADFRACNSLLLNFRGKQLAPGASKITVYRLLPAQAARFRDPTDF
jgi:hypothetical protein